MNFYAHLKNSQDQEPQETSTKKQAIRQKPRVPFLQLLTLCQPILTRYFSWQPPQSFLPMLPNVTLKDSRSFTLASAAFASLPSLARRALKSSILFQISGLALYGSSAVGWSIRFS